MTSIRPPVHLNNHHRDTLAHILTLGDETETFEPPKHKDIDAQQVVDLRRMLTNAGYGHERAASSGSYKAMISTSSREFEMSSRRLERRITEGGDLNRKSRKGDGQGESPDD